MEEFCEHKAKDFGEEESGLGGLGDLESLGGLGGLDGYDKEI